LDSRVGLSSIVVHKASYNGEAIRAVGIGVSVSNSDALVGEGMVGVAVFVIAIGEGEIVPSSISAQAVIESRKPITPNCTV
jgi:hypothetical protein